VARDLCRHPRRVGGEHAALVDDPGRAGVGLAELFDHLDVGGQVELGTAERAGEDHVKQAGVGQCGEQRFGQLTFGLGLVSRGADLGRQPARGFER
jgi:hypothetical protein